MNYKKIQAIFFLGILTMTLILVLAIFWPYLYTVIFALTLAVIFRPLYKKLSRHFKKHHGLPAFIIVVVVLLIIVIPLIGIGFVMVKEAGQLYTSLVKGDMKYILLSNAEAFVQEYLPNLQIDLVGSFNVYAQKTLTFLIDNFGPIFSNITSMLIGFFLTLFALYYLLKDGRKFKNALIIYSPLSDKYDIQIYKKLVTAVNSVVRGTLMISILQGLLAGIGFWIFQVPNPAILGTLAVFASLIPALGTVIVVAPACFYLFLTGHIGAAIGLFLWGSLLVGLIDNMLRPKLLEKDIKIHPFLIFISVIGGLSLFGAFGFIIGPLVLSLFFALLDIYKQEFRNYLE
jgi:predicted PurR-regulated permease PerM